jgi:hypothetical protein
MAIQAHKTEPMWDTDPNGLRLAMMALCPPTGRWSIYHNTDPNVIMHTAAYWMTKNSYPVAVLLNTVSHDTLPTHQEHWAVIQSIKTDLDPTTNSTVILKQVLIVDPVVPYTTTPTPRLISGTDWYSSEFLPVTKTGSVFMGEYITIVEPPEITGWAIAPIDVLVGKLITPMESLRKVLEGLKEHEVYEIKGFALFKKLKPSTPLLVNKHFGGYYLIPFTSNEQQGPANAAVLVNAYTGDLKQVKVFEQPVNFLTKNEAVEITLNYLKQKPDTAASAALVYRPGQSENKFYPLWQVTSGNRTLGIDQSGKITTNILRVEHSFNLPCADAQGLAWDGEHFLAIDGKSKKIFRLSSYTGRVLQVFTLELSKPKGLAFDGKTIWTADEGTRKLHSIDPSSGRILRTIKMDIPRDKGYKSIEGLTWDGKYLWTAYFAGFSSSLNQIDTESGRIIRSVFCDCNPRGIASDGRYVWSICYNGKGLPSKIDRREVQEKEHEMLRSRVFIRDIEGNDPTSLTYANKLLWYTDRELQKVFGIIP